MRTSPPTRSCLDVVARQPNWCPCLQARLPGRRGARAGLGRHRRGRAAPGLPAPGQGCRRRDVVVLDADVTGIERVGAPLGGADDPAGPSTSRPSSSTPPVPGATRWRGWPARGRSACGRCAAPRCWWTRRAASPAPHWPAAISIDETFYFKPDAGRLLLSPADEEPSPPCDAQPEDLEVAIAVDRFETGQRRPGRQGLASLGRPARVQRGPHAGGRFRPGRRGLLLARRPGRLRHPERRGARAGSTAALASGDGVPAGSSRPRASMPATWPARASDPCSPRFSTHFQPIHATPMRHLSTLAALVAAIALAL